MPETAQTWWGDGMLERDVWRLPQLSEQQILDLPAVFPLVFAARAWGIGEVQAGQKARAGTLPFDVVQLGPRQRVVRKADLLASLRMGEQADPTAGASGSAA